jgi:hypothetical protein
LGPFEVGLWKNIRRGWVFSPRFVKYEVRDRSKIRFLHDLWCGDHILKASFPELFSIAYCKEAIVANHVQFSNGNLQSPSLGERDC